jgi:hypothetical protein
VGGGQASKKQRGKRLLMAGGWSGDACVAVVRPQPVHANVCASVWLERWCASARNRWGTCLRGWSGWKALSSEAGGT